MNTLLKSVLASAVIASLPAIAAAQVCPNLSANGAPLDYTADSAYAPQSTRVIAGGSLNLSACSIVPGGRWTPRAGPTTGICTSRTRTTGCSSRRTRCSGTRR